jgi:beta-lactamase regulating signal transducer with metallopeptidase domain
MLCGLLVVFVCAIGVTYYLESASAPIAVAADNNSIKATPVNVHYNVMINHTVVSQNQTFISNVQAILNQNVSIIFMVWLLFFVMKSLKMVSGLLYIQRIRTYKTHDVTEELKHRIELFSDQIGIRRAIRLVQSELVKVPVAVGWLKPMILLPFGIALQLTPEQLDGILWHELAHIRRRDYLVNILQGLVETVFFFNPGLLWLSSLIRTEREACCDDMVLSRMNRKANYLEALLSFGYGEFKHAGYAMSLGSGNQLRDRMKRMISQENKRLGVVEKVVLVTGIVVLSAFAGLTKADNSINKKVTAKTIIPSVLKQRKASPMVNEPKPTDTAYNQIDSLVHFSSSSYKKGDHNQVTIVDIKAGDIHGKEYYLTLADNKLVAVEINGRKIKDSELGKYQSMVKVFKEREKAYGTALVNKMKAPEQQPLSVGPGALTDTLKLTLINMASDRNTADKLSVDKVNAKDNHGKNYYFIITNDKLTLMDIDGEKIKDADLPKYQYMVGQVREQLRISSANLKKRSNDGMPPQKPQEPTSPAAPPSLDKMIEDVTNDLINEHIIKDKSSLLTVKLTYSELLVNGVKQPDDIQKRLAAKYYPGNSRTSKNPNYGLWYNARTKGVALGTFNIDLDAL